MKSEINEALEALKKAIISEHNALVMKHRENLRKEIEQLQAKLKTAEEKLRWIPVSGRLPEIPDSRHNESSERVWLIFENKPQIGYYTNFAGWRIDGFYFQSDLNVTHWKPITLPLSKEKE